MTLRENLRSFRSRVRPEPPARNFQRGRIRSDDLGVRIETSDRDRRPSPAPAILWSDVHRAAAYKRDLFAYDLMCLFLARADGSGLELDEEMDGWMELLETLHLRLPGCRPHAEWYFEVMLPPFESRLREIYARR
jgi:hypothetical protein